MLQGFMDYLLKFLYGMFKHGAAVHFHMKTDTLDKLGGQPLFPATARIPDIKLFGVITVCMQMGGKDAGTVWLHCLYNRSACAVCKNYRAGPPLCTFVQSRRLYLSTDHQHTFVHPGLNKLIGDGKRINKTRTRIAYIQRPNPLETKFPLDKNAISGYKIIRGDGGKNNKVYVLCLDARPLYGHPGSVSRHAGNRVQPWPKPSPFFDPSPFHNPIMAGIHHT